MDFEKVFRENKEKTLEGKYITIDKNEPLLRTINKNKNLDVIRKSK